jgi:uncharacterized coiled-coil DUF342 family protein
MAAMTPERREVRKMVRALGEQIEAVKVLIRPLNEQLDRHRKSLESLQDKTCRHPAMKYGSAMGMGWCDCPDCGYSNP